MTIKTINTETVTPEMEAALKKVFSSIIWSMSNDFGMGEPDPKDVDIAWRASKHGCLSYYKAALEAAPAVEGVPVNKPLLLKIWDALNEECAGKCNAEYNPCWARELINEIDKELQQTPAVEGDPVAMMVTARQYHEYENSEKEDSTGYLSTNFKILKKPTIEGDVPLYTTAQTNMQDAYKGAREDLQIWKRRALEAEIKLKNACDSVEYWKFKFKKEEEFSEKIRNELNGPTFMGEPVLSKRNPPVEDRRTPTRMGANCRGSYVLGSACRKCAKCEEELQRLISNACQLKSPDSDPVAEVVWHDPRLMHPDSKRAPHKIIDASLAFYDKHPVGTKLYLHPQPSLAEKFDPELRKKVLELCDEIDDREGSITFSMIDLVHEIRQMLEKQNGGR